MGKRCEKSKKLFSFWRFTLVWFSFITSLIAFVHKILI
jgi:hypothetical protein